MAKKAKKISIKAKRKGHKNKGLIKPGISKRKDQTTAKIDKNALPNKVGDKKVSSVKPTVTVKKKKKTVGSKNDDFGSFEALRSSAKANLFSAAFQRENDDENEDMISDIEDKYQEDLHERDADKKPSVMPIVTPAGKIQLPDLDETMHEVKEEDDDRIDDEDDDEKVPFNAEISAVRMMIDHEKFLNETKVEIANLSANILEDPMMKLGNFNILFQTYNDRKLRGFVSVKKFVVLSLQEVFKELLPSYKISTPGLDQGVKLKKDTLKLEKHEQALLLNYRKYLSILGQLCGQFFKKNVDLKEDSHMINEGLAEIAVGALCSLLELHPNFNYSDNIAQTLAPLLNNRRKSLREQVAQTFKNIFREDKRGEITLVILRNVNRHIKKSNFNVKREMFEVLLTLRFRDVDLDRERDQLIKQKKLESHKSNVLRLSRTEKKRKAQLKKIEQEMLEANAEESKNTKSKFQTETLKITFGILFRVLKSCTDPLTVRLCLEGIAKFATFINVEFYFDLVEILNALLKQEWLDFSGKQYCIQTVFKILSEQGEVLNVDPLRFYNSLYESLLYVDAAKNHQDIGVVLETLTHCLLKRHKKISDRRLQAFMKRTVTLSLQLSHDGALGCLSIVRSLLQLNKSHDIVLDVESSIGDGNYRRELDDPEHCNAGATALYELALLGRHYHSDVVEFAKYVGNGLPTQGAGEASAKFGRSTAKELYKGYEMSTMNFVPAVPIPKKVPARRTSNKYGFCSTDFKHYCYNVVNSCK